MSKPPNIMGNMPSGSKLPSSAILLVVSPPTADGLSKRLTDSLAGYFGGTSIVLTSSLQLSITCPSEPSKAHALEQSGEPLIQGIRTKAFHIAQEGGLSKDGRPSLKAKEVKGLVRLIRTLLPGPVLFCGLPATVSHLAAVEKAAEEPVCLALSLCDALWDKTEARVWDIASGAHEGVTEGGSVAEAEAHRQGLLAALRPRRTGYTAQPVFLEAEVGSGSKSRSQTSGGSQDHGATVRELASTVTAEVDRRRAAERAYLISNQMSRELAQEGARREYRQYLEGVAERMAREMAKVSRAKAKAARARCLADYRLACQHMLVGQQDEEEIDAEEDGGVGVEPGASEPAEGGEGGGGGRRRRADEARSRRDNAIPASSNARVSAELWVEGAPMPHASLRLRTIASSRGGTNDIDGGHTISQQQQQPKASAAQPPPTRPSPPTQSASQHHVISSELELPRLSFKPRLLPSPNAMVHDIAALRDSEHRWYTPGLRPPPNPLRLLGRPGCTAVGFGGGGVDHGKQRHMNDEGSAVEVGSGQLADAAGSPSHPPTALPPIQRNGKRGLAIRSGGAYNVGGRARPGNDKRWTQVKDSYADGGVPVRTRVPAHRVAQAYAQGAPSVRTSWK